MYSFEAGKEYLSAIMPGDDETVSVFLHLQRRGLLLVDFLEEVFKAAENNLALLLAHHKIQSLVLRLLQNPVW